MTLEVAGTFDGAKAWELRRQIETERGAIVIDFEKVREFYDFGVAVLAHGVAERPTDAGKVRITGLQQRHRKMFRHFGIEVEP